MDKIEEQPQSQYSDEEIDKYFERSFNLFKNGNPDMARNRFKQEIVECNISPELIYNKYRQHIEFCKPFQKEGFTKKEYKISDLYDFVHWKSYTKEFGSFGTNNYDRDKYFYGEDLIG